MSRSGEFLHRSGRASSENGRRNLRESAICQESVWRFGRRRRQEFGFVAVGNIKGSLVLHVKIKSHENVGKELIVHGLSRC